MNRPLDNLIPTAPSPWQRFWRHCAAGAQLVVADLRRRPLLYGTVYTVVMLVFALAAVRVFVYHRPFLPVLFNITPSLPYTLAYVEYGDISLQRGDYIVYAFEGSAGRTSYPGLWQQPFFKRILGVGGDMVSVHGRQVYVNDVLAGQAKTHTFERKPLTPIEPGVIPPGMFYVQGTSPDSFDSRYRESGLVERRQVWAKVHPLF